MRLTPVFLFALIFILISINLYAQVNNKKVFTPNGTTFLINSVNEKNGRPVHYLVVEQPQQSGQLSTEKRLIVKFKAEPLAKSTLSAQGKRANLDNEHKLFLEDIQRLQQTNSARSVTVIKILNEYKTVFNGFSIVASSEIEQQIKDLPYVKSVTEDKKVETVDQTSNQVINAEKVWTELNITGRGVVIGIIDTGIDYTHPDLGGGLGATSKVIGGYDFVNDDPDPIDDHGHGTHVAGIAAANGAIKGVAPDAKLMAFKVLTAEGWGYDSWILAAIERTVDPDQNPNTDDAPDVVNMSLGRNTDPAEPFSEAISNATSLGVTFVVSAGNNYDYQTVGTPGVAESAITVGATDNFDYAANFSSKGPTEDDYRIKPDVCAPGVDIYSTFLNNTYETLSGTSMASPHVAGAVALLLEKNPTWTPEIIKGVLMQSAKKLFYDVWTQGAGRINVLEALQNEVVLTPGSISLGILDVEDNWSKTVTLSVTNFSTQTKTISFQIEGNIVHPSITYSISPSSLVLPGSQSSSITVTFNVIPSQLPLLNYKEGYFGKLVASYDASSVESTIALIKPKLLKIKMTGELPNLVVIVGTGQSQVWKPFYPTSSLKKFVLPDDTYNLTAMYGSNRYVIKEGISNNSTVELAKSDASNQIIFNPKSEEGTIIPTGVYQRFGTTTLNGYNIITFDPYLRDTVFISNSNTYKIDFHLTDTIQSVPNKLYSIAATTGTGIHESKTISNDPSSYSTVNIEIPNSESLEDYQLTYYSQRGIPNLLGQSVPSTSLGRTPLVKSPLKVLISQDELPIDRAVFVKMESVNTGDAWESSSLRASKPDHLKFFDKFLRPIDSISNIQEFNYTLGKTLLGWAGRIYCSENQIYLCPAWPNGGLFKYHYGDFKRGPINYELKSNNTVVDQGILYNHFYEQALEQVEGAQKVFNVSTSAHQLTLSFPYQIEGVESIAKMISNFDLQQSDKVPPSLVLLSLENNGISVNEVKGDEPALLKFRFSEEDFCFSCESMSGIAESSLHIKKSESEDWVNIPTHSSNNFQYATLYGLSEGLYDLKLTSNDNGSNALTYEIKPAFTVSNSGPIFFEPVSLLTPSDGTTRVYTQPEFKWTTSPFSISYTLQLSRLSDFSSIEAEYVTLDTVYQTMESLDFLSQYYWRVKSNYAGGSSSWSEFFTFTTREQPTVSLLAPDNHAINIFILPEYRWTEVPQAESYTLQLSRSANFSLTEEEHITSPSFTPTLPLDYDTQYYWRVRANEAEGPSDWSTFFTFTTSGPSPVSLLEPTNEATNVSARPALFRWTAAPKAIWYKFQVSTQPDFSEIFLEYGPSETSVLLYFELSHSTTYYWRVQVLYAEGFGEWSSTFIFTTSESPIFESVSLLAPANDATNLSIIPEFSWTSASSAVSYIIQISQQYDFSSVNAEYATLDTLFSPPSNLDLSSLYYWRVLTSFEGGHSEWSEVFRFETTQGEVTLLVPANHVPTNSNLVEFKWGKIQGISDYHFEISENLNSDSPIDAIIVSDTVYHCPIELPPNTLLFWRVRPFYFHDGQWKFGSWSNPFDFSVVITDVLEELEKSSVYAFPNPFTETVTIGFQLDSPGTVLFEITDSRGVQVDQFDVTYAAVGKHSVHWKVKTTVSGIYLCKIISGDTIKVVKLILRQ